MSIFVFGSNDKGWHGKGAALTARRKHGAIYGQGEGMQGSSYAISTKFWNPQTGHLETLPLSSIAQNVTLFLEFARAHPELLFYVTQIGCGLAGYKPADIAPLFAGASPNCQLPEGWENKLFAVHSNLGQNVFGSDSH